MSMPTASSTPSKPTLAPSSDGGRLCLRGCFLWTRRGRHELGADGIVDGLGHDGLDVGVRLVVEPEAHQLVDRDELARVPRSPQRHGYAARVEHPPQGQREDARLVTL